ncbi:hypothetical protein BSZ35_19030 [Salinibacter sp. 10B]|uniref:hypothetical protein n=1 Tax=Salinibacter sp. 10B TaxID=1923971 RepID=UPI000D2AE741|nr:hypothetical protein [Salinibacter sp. 10B]PQJ26744.1 hypothetical protein BSZ35_19030 [Salinibacter sp. 10B]
MHDAIDVLDFLGYEHIRLHGGDWRPIASAGGQLGTADNTHLFRHSQEDGVMRLVDGETGDQIGFARKN